MKKLEFEHLSNLLQTDSRTARLAKPGFCRMWSQQAIKVAREFRAANQVSFIIEAREKEVQTFLFHTFLRFLGEETYLADGTGTADFDPFYGQEIEAPHLLSSRIDALQYYDLADEPR